MKEYCDKDLQGLMQPNGFRLPNIGRYSPEITQREIDMERCVTKIIRRLRKKK